MKYLSIKSMAPCVAILTAMVSNSVSAQSTVTDKVIDATDQFTVTKVEYQDADESSNKNFSGNYYLNLAASGSEINIAADDYVYAQGGCIYFDTNAGFLEINLHMPDGHRIRGVRYYYKDSSIGFSRAQLYIAPSTGSFSSLVNVDSTGNSGTYASEYEDLPSTHFVNNAENAYVMRLYTNNTGTDQQMCGVRLFMTTP